MESSQAKPSRAKKAPAAKTAKSVKGKAPVGASPKGAARREEILSGLMDKIAQQELRNPSLREIGRALELEPAHILYYFKSREDLLQSVIIRWDENAAQYADGLAMTLDNFAEQVRRNIAIPGVVHLYLTFAAEAVDPAHAAHDFFRQRFDRVCQTLEQRIVEEQRQGRIAADVDPVSKARQLIALSDGLQLQSLVDPKVDAAQVLFDAIGDLRQS
ncbi:TetR/AcrR family transcriptional regulator [Novosphingobium umbonatum]|nr:TetR/AcrR family transcriptional regulator [Novosphingobium umbonatum]